MTKKELRMTYEHALAEAQRKSTAHCSDAELMAQLCDGSMQILLGAVSPKLIWEGAQRRGMTCKELLDLCHKDKIAAAELMW